MALMLALVAVMVWIGVYPKPFFDPLEQPVNYIVKKVDPTYFDRNPLVYPPANSTSQPEHVAEAK
jgi:NADH:ubiquinone oxidoreductase subunit 4 (subunit M)